MLKIRLARVGRKHDPSYRVIVTEKGRGPQTGAYHEKLGTYDARSDEYELKDERIEHWLAEGAQPSDTVHNLLVKAEIIDDDTINPLPNKSPVTPGEDEQEEEQESEEIQNQEVESSESETKSSSTEGRAADDADEDDQSEEDPEPEEGSNDEVETSVSESKSRPSGEESDAENDTDEQDNEVDGGDDGESEEDQEEES
jgi:small subunit ribosomal protein S16